MFAFFVISKGQFPTLDSRCLAVACQFLNSAIHHITLVCGQPQHISRRNDGLPRLTFAVVIMPDDLFVR